ncbi:unnamed protein product [Brassica oleracea]
MTRHVILTSEERNSPPTTMIKHAERRKVGEVAGGAAAECAAVWCCGPCAAVNLVVLAVYRVPAAVSAAESTVHARLKEEDPTAEIVFEENVVNVELNDVVVLEDEMFERFYGAGFWRSPSQRDTSSGKHELDIIEPYGFALVRANTIIYINLMLTMYIGYNRVRRDSAAEFNKVFIVKGIFWTILRELETMT